MSRARVTINTRGLERTKAAIARYAQTHDRAVKAAWYQIGQWIMSKAIPITPKQYGTLRRSAYVAPPEKWGVYGYVVEIGFGTNYALYVHEMPDTNHFRAPNTGPKYLQRAIESVQLRLPQTVAKLIRRNIKGGVGLGGAG